MNIKMAIEFTHAGITPVEMAIKDYANDVTMVESLEFARKLLMEAEGVLTNAAKREETARVAAST